MSSQEDKCSLFVKMLLLLGGAAEFRLGRKQIPVMGKKMAEWDYQSCLFTDVCERLWAECVNVALQWLTLEM